MYLHRRCESTSTSRINAGFEDQLVVRHVVWTIIAQVGNISMKRAEGWRERCSR